MYHNWSIHACKGGDMESRWWNRNSLQLRNLGEVLDIINLSKNDTICHKVIEIVEKRKKTKQSCDVELVISCIANEEISELSVRDAIKTLLNEKALLSSSYRGKIVLRISQEYKDTSEVGQEWEDEHVLINEYISFKKHVLDSLANLNGNLESLYLNNKDRQLETLKAEIDSKDTIISILREELAFLRSENLKLIDVSTRRNNCCVTIDSDSHDVTHSNSFKVDTTKNQNKSQPGIDKISDEQQNELQIVLQLTDIRKKLHNKFTEHKEILNRKQSLCVDGVKCIKPTNENESETKNITNADDRKHVIVCGDSILNGLDGAGLSSKYHRTTVRNFPGSTSSDLLDYVKPLCRKKPHQIILHIGTNDLTNDAISTVENVRNIVDHVTTNSPGTEIVLSDVCIRDDKPQIQQKVNILNKALHVFCSKNNIRCIKNANIETSCLSKKKLHLNKKGLSKLAVNLKEFIQKK